jgi:hypothetical protein
MEDRVELLAKDLERLSKPMTGADWIRVLRSAREKLDPEGNAHALVEVIMQSLLEDHGVAENYREELLQEIPHMTTQELATTRDVILRLRSGFYEQSERCTPTPPGPDEG